MFRTMYDRAKLSVIESVPGDAIKEEYQLRIIDNQETLEPVGKTDMYEYIQSHADSVDIHKILERCALIDDYSILNKMPAQFMDVTDMPKNLADAYSMIQDAKNMFERMPVDIKDKYDNNFVEFISSIGSEKFNNIAGEFIESVKKKDIEKKNIVLEDNGDVKE